MFPVGDLTKPAVRDLAKKAGLNTHDKAESQDICFVSGSVSDFLVRIGKNPKSGQIVRKDGSVIGQHEGIQNFTVGQRRGVKIGGFEKPLYVVEINPGLNQVVVGEKSDLERPGFFVGECNWIEDLGDEFEAIAQLRHRHSGVRVSAYKRDDKVEVKFLNETSVVSPGQACVFYDLGNQKVLGGGVIIRE